MTTESETSVSEPTIPGYDGRPLTAMQWYERMLRNCRLRNGPDGTDGCDHSVGACESAQRSTAKHFPSWS